MKDEAIETFLGILFTSGGVLSLTSLVGDEFVEFVDALIRLCGGIGNVAVGIIGTASLAIGVAFLHEAYTLRRPRKKGEK